MHSFHGAMFTRTDSLFMPALLTLTVKSTADIIYRRIYFSSASLPLPLVVPCVVSWHLVIRCSNREQERPSHIPLLLTCRLHVERMLNRLIRSLSSDKLACPENKATNHFHTTSSVSSYIWDSERRFFLSLPLSRILNCTFIQAPICIFRSFFFLHAKNNNTNLIFQYYYFIIRRVITHLTTEKPVCMHTHQRRKYNLTFSSRSTSNSCAEFVLMSLNMPKKVYIRYLFNTAFDTPSCFK